MSISKAIRIIDEHKTILSTSWKAQEIVIINTIISNHLSSLNKISIELNAIESDIYLTEQEIKREDEAAAEQKRLELEKLLKEQLERGRLI